jgi:hypothetical protein
VIALRVVLSTVAAAVLSAAVAPACTTGRASQPSPPSTAPTVRASSVDPQGAVKAQVITAYDTFWRTVEHAALTANWRDPALTRVAVDPELRAISQKLYAWNRDGRVARGHIDLRPTVVSIDGRAAVLNDCQDSSGWVVQSRDGRYKERTKPHRDFAKVSLVLRGVVWKVASVHFEQRAC